MSFHHILFPTDFSQGSYALNRQVEWLAQRFNSRVTLLHVFELPAGWYVTCDTSFINMSWVNGLRDSAQRSLKEYGINVPEANLNRVLAEGDVAVQIMEFVRTQNVDLIVMGTHSFGALESLVMGSETAKVLHTAPCPIWTDSLLHAQKCTAAISNILCAVDTIEEAIPLLRYTQRLASELDASVSIIHTVPAIEDHSNQYFVDLHRHLTQSAKTQLQKIQQEAGTDFPIIVSEDGVSAALSQGAKDCDADLIIIGRGKAQKPLGRFRTHAYDIIRHAPCPVLSCCFDLKDHPSSTRPAKHISRTNEDAHLETRAAGQ